MIVDVRLVLGRDGALRASIEGRRVAGLPPTDDVAVLLGELARRVESAAWSTGRSTLEEATAPDSPIFTR